jgi:hypothetical protein
MGVARASAAAPMSTISNMVILSPGTALLRACGPFCLFRAIVSYIYLHRQKSQKKGLQRHQPRRLPAHETKRPPAVVLSNTLLRGHRCESTIAGGRLVGRGLRRRPFRLPKGPAFSLHVEDVPFMLKVSPSCRGCPSRPVISRWDEEAIPVPGCEARNLFSPLPLGDPTRQTPARPAKRLPDPPNAPDTLFPNGTRCSQTVHVVPKRYTLFPNGTRCSQTAHVVSKRHTLFPNGTRCFQTAHVRYSYHGYTACFSPRPLSDKNFPTAP